MRDDLARVDAGVHVETYVVPRIGGVPLQDLNAANVNKLYAELPTGGKVDVSAALPCPPSTMCTARYGGRPRMPCGGVWSSTTRPTGRTLPRDRKVEAERRAALRVWTADELAGFLATTARHHTLWEVAASTGLRRNELCGLRWASVDLDAGTIAVRDRVVIGDDGYQLEDGTKSDRSARTIDLDRRTVELLRMHREQQPFAERAAGPAWEGLGARVRRRGGGTVTDWHTGRYRR